MRKPPADPTSSTFRDAAQIMKGDAPAPKSAAKPPLPVAIDSTHTLAQPAAPMPSTPAPQPSIHMAPVPGGTAVTHTFSGPDHQQQAHSHLAKCATMGSC